MAWDWDAVARIHGVLACIVKVYVATFLTKPKTNQKWVVKTKTDSKESSGREVKKRTTAARGTTSSKPRRASSRARKPSVRPLNIRVGKRHFTDDVKHGSMLPVHQQYLVEACRKNIALEASCRSRTHYHRESSGKKPATGAERRMKEKSKDARQWLICRRDHCTRRDHGHRVSKHQRKSKPLMASSQPASAESSRGERDLSSAETTLTSDFPDTDAIDHDIDFDSISTETIDCDPSSCEDTDNEDSPLPPSRAPPRAPQWCNLLGGMVKRQRIEVVVYSHTGPGDESVSSYLHSFVDSIIKRCGRADETSRDTLLGNTLVPTSPINRHTLLSFSTSSQASRNIGRILNWNSERKVQVYSLAFHLYNSDKRLQRAQYHDGSGKAYRSVTEVIKQRVLEWQGFCGWNDPIVVLHTIHWLHNIMQYRSAYLQHVAQTYSSRPLE